MSSTVAVEPARNEALYASASALRRMTGYELPAELDKRILDLGERKESLTTEERAELLAWVSFTQQRSIEKYEAQLALKRLASVFPEMTAEP